MTTDANGPGPEAADTKAILIESSVHGDVAEWNPSPPPLPPPPSAAPWTPADPNPLDGQSPPPPELEAGETKRAFSLDALRGLFLISMTLGFTIATKHLPIWMYHRQFPFDSPVAVDAPGISWRDLAYASFLFTMAAALPLTLSRRIDKGELEIGIVVAAVRRYGLLLIYALLIAHSSTGIVGETQLGRTLSIAGFVIMAMVFTRRRSDWNASAFRIINSAGWVLAIAFLALSPLTYGQTFSFSRIDDIIAGLAFASLTGSLVWYFTRTNPTLRIAILGLAVAMFLGAKGDGWVARWWFDARWPWLFSAGRFVLLAVVIPGTIAGDIILRWMRESESSPATAGSWGRVRAATLTAIGLAFTPVVTVGLFNRNLETTTALAGGLFIAGVILTWAPVRPVERMLRSLYLAAGVWLFIGLFLEPFDGGIRKVPDNLSYFFTVTGTTSMLLVALTALIDVLGKRRWVAALIDVGHNPLLLYVLFNGLINSALELVPPLRPVLMGSIPTEVVRYLLEVLIVVLIVRAMSRRRIYWRT